MRPLRFGVGLVASIVLALVCGSLWQTYCERRDAERYPAPGTLYEVGGTRLHMRCMGEGSPTVLMFSGSGAPSVVSYELQDRVAKETRVCSYDRAGLGWSDAAVSERSLAASADDLMALLDQAGEPGPFILAPESYGGMIALLVVDRRPDLVSGMVLIDSQEPELWFEKTGETLPAMSRRTFMMALGWRVGLVRIGLRFGQPEWIDNMSEQNQAWFKALYSRRMPGYGELMSAYRLTDPSLYESFAPGCLGSLPIKVLVHGTVTDMLSPEFEGGWMDAQKRLAGYSARSELIVAENNGHAMVGENPDFVAAQVLDMVEKVRTQTR